MPDEKRRRPSRYAHQTQGRVPSWRYRGDFEAARGRRLPFPSVLCAIPGGINAPLPALMKPLQELVGLGKRGVHPAFQVLAWDGLVAAAHDWRMAAIMTQCTYFCTKVCELVVSWPLQLC